MITGELYREMMKALEDVKRIPLREMVSVNISGYSEGSATIEVPQGWRFYIKSWRVIKGSKIQVLSITVDGHDTYQTDDLEDTVSEYGELLVADEKIEILGRNTGKNEQNLHIEIKGFKDEVNK